MLLLHLLVCKTKKSLSLIKNVIVLAICLPNEFSAITLYLQSQIKQFPVSDAPIYFDLTTNRSHFLSISTSVQSLDFIICSVDGLALAR